MSAEQPEDEGKEAESEPETSAQPHGWMIKPTNVPENCPPGFEYLTAIDQMLIEQQTALMEPLADTECTDKFKIVNGSNEQIYFVTENSESKPCCKHSRGFVIHVWDSSGTEVMKITRIFKFLACCCWCSSCAACSSEVEIEVPVGQVIGRVKETQSCMGNHFEVLSINNDVLLKIIGTANSGPCGLTEDDFGIYTPDQQSQIGKISKKWTGQEMFSNSDKFGISYPMDLDIRTKTLLFGALFLINVMFFENHTT